MGAQASGLAYESVSQCAHTPPCDLYSEARAMAEKKVALDGQAFINTLLAAEKKAEEQMANAKKNRIAKLREAKAAADEELKVFKEQEEANFQKTMGTKAKAD